MHLLTPVLRPYDWGSREAIPELLGFDPGEGPVAEAWWGAPPEGSAIISVDGKNVPLHTYISADATAALGSEVADRWQGALPYLLKVLAVQHPLSIQVHPNAVQAAEGFARENSAGIPLTARERHFKDPQHKPELVLALTEMVLLAGFRDVAALDEDLARIGGEQAAILRTVLSTPTGPATAIAEYTRAALAVPHGAPVLEALIDSAAHADASESHRVAAQALASHPGDVGALVALALNVIKLEPGQACFTGAGVVHSYQSGLGLEVMANSDNVVRAGLTSKAIDTELLLQLAQTEPGGPDRPMPVVAGEQRTFITPAHEFALTMMTGGTSEFAHGPRMVLALEGSAVVQVGDNALELRRGQAAFVPHHAGPLRVTVAGMAAAVSVPAVTAE